MLPCLTGSFPEDDLCGYNELSSIIREYVPDQRTEIADFGCGYSGVLLSLYGQGYHLLTGIDIDYAVVSKMAEKTKTIESIDWRAEDIRSLPLPNETFGCILFKNVFSMTTLQLDICSAIEAVHEAHRVLCHNGVLICVSTLSSEQLSMVLQGPGLTWTPVSISTSHSLAGAEQQPAPRVPYIVAILRKP
ncbi:Methyltransferase domain-containing protein [Giardia duodenalis]|uniref:Methyltransferase domain-containing protein n=2 Tax=Giardia intestinalis TaxID=5741 RepID=D3KGS6_GIAIC|nr:Methyltransferase domain-containing protein [Giardia intestinalis]ESU39459.1 Hypothetical protein DHA2_151651 [Giardia intestinalis]KAE8302119.1 Methyltransferase domain-containing protein [Giardia intestinalis]